MRDCQENAISLLFACIPTQDAVATQEPQIAALRKRAVGDRRNVIFWSAHFRAVALRGLFKN
jgi:hypothetical protein